MKYAEKYSKSTLFLLNKKSKSTFRDMLKEILSYKIVCELPRNRREEKKQNKTQQHGLLISRAS
jgi:hypothetical protein